MEVFQISGLWDQEIDLWSMNHEPLIPTLTKQWSDKRYIVKLSNQNVYAGLEIRQGL